MSVLPKKQSNLMFEDLLFIKKIGFSYISLKNY